MIEKTELNLEIEVSPTLTEAEDAIRKGSFDLMVLDISMDISEGGNEFFSDNHDMLGGLRFAKELFLNALELPTIVVTAHESFLEKSANKAQVSSFMSISDLKNEFSDLLGDLFLGVVRYQKTGWDAQLFTLVSEATDI
ncbi:response regulator [Roseovarius sp. A-2]|uniref:response regulator n=1 Tax=Roseovarius sp. A-2 TaxID=1570360 RepID=UPI0020CB1773|nr:response regulator [Roseovarius sp. A-2]